jgi:uncharacterized protein with HEPN domain
VKQRPTGPAERDQALETLEAITLLRDGDRESFNASEDHRWALAFLWLSVGSALKQFCRLRGIEQGSSPFPGPIRMRDRLYYRPPSTVSPRILWDTCLHDADPLALLLRDLRAVVVLNGR